LSNSIIEAKYGNGLSISEEHATSLGPPSIILDYLVLGNSFDAKSTETMESLRIGRILNVADECDRRCRNKKVKYLKLVVQDMVEEGNQFDVFDKAFQFIDEAKQATENAKSSSMTQSTRCFVHCMRGRSRIATIIIAYLMKTLNWSLKEAYSHVKERREPIGPHHFMKRQLIDYEIHLFRSSSMDVNITWTLENVVAESKEGKEIDKQEVKEEV